MRDPAASRRLRVITISDGIVGGAEALAALIAQRLDPERFESTLCATRWDPQAEEEEALAALERTPTRFIGIRRSSRLDLRPWPRLVRTMRELRIDVIHTHKVGSNIWGALLAPRVPVPVFVAHEHSWSWQGKPYRRLVDRELIARRASAMVAVSGIDRRLMTEVEGIPPEKTRFIPMGIPDPVRGDPAADIRAELGISAAQPVVGVVAALRPQKAFEVLIDAAALVKRELPDVRFLIVGGEEDPGKRESPRLERYAAERGLERTVTLVGARSDVFDVICGFDVGALSSDYEGSPRTVLEYMEAAKPVVATRVGGVPDMVREGETGRLVEPRDPEALAAALVSVLRDRERARTMGRAGQELRRREFTLDAMVARVEGLYEELFAEAAGARA